MAMATIIIRGGTNAMTVKMNLSNKGLQAWHEQPARHSCSAPMIMQTTGCEA
jgi:hypothetical protein